MTSTTHEKIVQRIHGASDLKTSIKSVGLALPNPGGQFGRNKTSNSGPGNGVEAAQRHARGRVELATVPNEPYVGDGVSRASTLGQTAPEGPAGVESACSTPCGTAFNEVLSELTVITEPGWDNYQPEGDILPPDIGENVLAELDEGEQAHLLEALGAAQRQAPEPSFEEGGNKSTLDSFSTQRMPAAHTILTFLERETVTKENNGKLPSDTSDECGEEGAVRDLDQAIEVRDDEVVLYLPTGADLVCRVGRCGLTFLTPVSFYDHVTRAHRQTHRCRVICSNCGRTCKSAVGHAIHWGYGCKGRAPSKSGTKAFQCSECICTFTSERARSTHIRHEHPVLCNELRRFKNGLPLTEGVDAADIVQSVPDQGFLHLDEILKNVPLASEADRGELTQEGILRMVSLEASGALGGVAKMRLTGHIATQCGLEPSKPILDGIRTLRNTRKWKRALATVREQLGKRAEETSTPNLGRECSSPDDDPGLALAQEAEWLTDLQIDPSRVVTCNSSALGVEILPPSYGDCMAKSQPGAEITTCRIDPAGQEPVAPSGTAVKPRGRNWQPCVLKPPSEYLEIRREIETPTAEEKKSSLFVEPPLTLVHTYTPALGPAERHIVRHRHRRKEREKEEGQCVYERREFYGDPMLESLADGDMGPELVDGVLDGWLRDIGNCSNTIASKDNRGDNRGGRRTAEPKRVNSKRFKAKQRKKLSKRAAARLARQRAYLLHRGLYRDNRRKLARLLLDGAEDVGCDIEVGEVEREYRRIMSIKGSSCGVKGSVENYPEPEVRAKNSGLMVQVRAEEVQRHLKQVKRGSAPGPDAVKAESLKAWAGDCSRLAALFSAWLHSGRVSPSLKKSRSILLPKTNDRQQLKSLSRWRPLTIGCHILRLFNRILASRLSEAVSIHVRQRGFLKAVNGCAENLTLLTELLDGARRADAGSQLAVLFVDFSKAFDTIKHDYLWASLRRLGVGSPFVELIQNMYDGSMTSFKTRRGTTNPISIMRGVKQGCPLSPLLFSIAVDPLITQLEQLSLGKRVPGGGTVSCLSFADDTALVSDDPDKIQTMLDCISRFGELSGLELNPLKCEGFVIQSLGGKAGSTLNQNIIWRGKGKTVPILRPDSTLRYLGGTISAWCSPRTDGQNISQCEKYAECVDRASLKPTEKVQLWRECVLPRFLYDLQFKNPTKSYLSKLDEISCKMVKRWLRLPNCATNHFLWSARRHGGLGLPKMQAAGAITRIRTLMAATLSKDPVLVALARSLDYGSLARDLSRKFNLPAPKPGKPYKRIQWVLDEHEKWASKRCQGSGAMSFKSSLSNSWNASWDQNRDSGFAPGQIIAAQLLRVNLFPCGEVLARGSGREIPRCRWCRGRDTLGHISGECPGTRARRIRRHNKILEQVCAFMVGRGWLVEREPSIWHGGRLWRPDVIARLDKRIVVCDITCRWERVSNTFNSLEEGNLEKIKKYRVLRSTLEKRYGTKDIHFCGYTVGARGGWVKSSEVLLRHTDASETAIGGFISRTCSTALRQTIKVFGSHSDRFEPVGGGFDEDRLDTN